jgi:hypothetical protein
MGGGELHSHPAMVFAFHVDVIQRRQFHLGPVHTLFIMIPSCSIKGGEFIDQSLCSPLRGRRAFVHAFDSRCIYSP